MIISNYCDYGIVKFPPIHSIPPFSLSWISFHVRHWKSPQKISVKLYGFSEFSHHLSPAARFQFSPTRVENTFFYVISIANFQPSSLSVDAHFFSPPTRSTMRWRFTTWKILFQFFSSLFFSSASRRSERDPRVVVDRAWKGKTSGIHSFCCWLMLCCSRQEIDGFNLAHSSCHHQQDGCKNGWWKTRFTVAAERIKCEYQWKILYALARRVKFTSFRPYIFFVPLPRALCGWKCVQQIHKLSRRLISNKKRLFTCWRWIECDFTICGLCPRCGNILWSPWRCQQILNFRTSWKMILPSCGKLENEFSTRENHH